MNIGDKVYKKGNTIINKFSGFKEIVMYKSDFNYSLGTDLFADEETGEIIEKDIDRSRKFYEDENGVLHPLNDSVKIETLQNTILKSCARAKDNFYGYALCNKWQYFITLTYSPKKVDRNNEDDLKYKWQLFREKLQRINKDVKIICTPERHPTSGKLHLHCLVGNIDLTSYCTISLNPHTGKKIKSKYGQQVFNISLWDYGYTTLVELEENYNQLQVANYLISYVTKDGNIGYNKKKYYRTHNLEYKNKEIFCLDWTEKMELTKDIKPYKENETMIVYRVFYNNKSTMQLDFIDNDKNQKK